MPIKPSHVPTKPDFVEFKENHWAVSIAKKRKNTSVRRAF